MPRSVCGNPTPRSVCGNPMPRRVCGTPMPRSVCANPTPHSVCGNLMPRRVCGNPMPRSVCGNPTPRGVCGNPTPRREPRFLPNTKMRKRKYYNFKTVSGYWPKLEEKTGWFFGCPLRFVCNFLFHPLHFFSLTLAYSASFSSELFF